MTGEGGRVLRGGAGVRFAGAAVGEHELERRGATGPRPTATAGTATGGHQREAHTGQRPTTPAGTTTRERGPAAQLAEPGGRIPGRPRIGEVDFWLLPVHPRPAWLPLLDAAERARADRLAATPAGDVFTASRALQRLWAAAVLGVAPDDVVIDRSCEHCGDPAHGRPRLTGAPAFSVSHTARRLLLAVAGAGRIGADIEDPAAASDPAGLAGVVLSAAEHREFSAAPPADHPARLLTAWTRKEAAMKLAGLGLAAPPARVDVRGPIARSDVPGWPGEPVHLRALTVPGDHLAALATTVPVRAVHRRDLAALDPRGAAAPP